jgi:hypothetical protein
MKATKTIIAGIALAAVVGLVVYAVRRHKKNGRQSKVAEHGYETAYDILFPSKNKRKQKLQYGPVTPS